MAKKEKNRSNVSLELYKEIQPLGGITFNDESVIKTGDGYEQCLHVMRYPAEIDNFWLSNVTNIENTVVTIDISNEDINEVKKNINRSMKEQNSRYRASNDYISQSDAEQKFNDMKEMIDEINAMKEVMKSVDTRIFISDRSWLQLDEKSKNLRDKLDSDGYMACINLNETKNDWQSMFQTYTLQQENQYAVPGQSLTSRAVAGGNPFHFSSLEDVRGTFYGTTPTSGNVLLDLFSKTSTRKFYNALAVGTMGSGKSTLLKKIEEDRAIRGDYIRAFDVSGEFSMLTKELGGKILKLDGTDKNALNPLEILRAGDDEGVNFARHVAKLNTMYRFLNPECTQDEVTQFANCINEFYGELNLLPTLGNTITGRAAKDYPIFSDFHEFLKRKMDKIAGQTYNEVELVVAQNEILLTDKIDKIIIYIITTYGKLFNQVTSMDNIVDESIVVFDISELKEMDDNIFDAQIFNMISLCWDNCVTNGTLMNQKLRISKEITLEDVRHFMILIDESHRWINAQKLQALDMITVYMREARKYLGGIMLASQSIRDYVPEGSSDIAVNKLKTLFELTQYKFIFHQDSNTIPLFDVVFNNVLTQSQLDRIPRLETGSCILSIASDRNLEFNVFITDEEEYIFNGGL